MNVKIYKQKIWLLIGFLMIHGSRYAVSITFLHSRILAWVVDYVETSLGPKYTSPPSLDIASSFENSNCLTPLLFILSPGSDPMAALHQFARNKQFLNHLHTVSLGVGQDKEAKTTVMQCVEEGSWVCLQNCHLAPCYMSSLERLCDSLTLHNTSMEFRLWLTSAPTPQFPISILQSSVKMTTDLPTGLKRRLLTCYLTEPIFDENFFYGCPGKDRAFAKLLYSISYLHAVIQERGKYNRMGWNCSYEFTEVDFYISLQQLQMYINKYDDIPYNIIQYVIGECNYGGHLYNAWDRRLLNTLISDMINVQVVKMPNYQLCPVSDKYQVPLRFEYHNFVIAIQELPDNPTSEVFGLNYNVEIQHNISITQELFATLKLLQPNGPQSKHFLNYGLSIVETILRKLPEEMRVESEIAKSDCLWPVVIQECRFYNCLLSTICTTLNTFRSTCLGTGEMPQDFEELHSQLESGQIPSSWLKVSYSTCKTLGPYIDDLIGRLKYLKSCCTEGISEEVWLPGLFSPQALLIAVLYQHSQLTHIPFHLLSFDHVIVTADHHLTHSSGIIVSGLYIYAAQWNQSQSTLEEQGPRQFSSRMPKIWYKPSLKTDEDCVSRYTCPVYTTTARNDFISQVMIPTSQNPSHWVYRGVILLCQVEL